MRNSMKKLFKQYVAVLTCLLLLFSLVIPHHHHQDGTPCCASIEWEHSHGDESADTHHNGCEGHTLAVLDSQHDNDIQECFLLPLCVLYDYVYPPKITFFSQFLEAIDASNPEALYNALFLSVVGLRAPPMA